MIPDVVEFWQRRSNRLHDRICYQWQDECWLKARLLP
ncbi:pyridoxine 5'-phosphate oxidase C-terminal domain-containing protein [Cricetibacter osteomyelitidis]|nr:pyridoxine 5'-phosphate oxidase C-terminal domain-containing protein [Cricetibacter osteomyelitidis]